MKVRTLIMGKIKVRTLILALANVSEPLLHNMCKTHLTFNDNMYVFRNNLNFYNINIPNMISLSHTYFIKKQ